MAPKASEISTPTRERRRAGYQETCPRYALQARSGDDRQCILPSPADRSSVPGIANQDDLLRPAEAAEGQSELGPKVMRVSYDDGAEGIEIDAGRATR